MSPESPQIYFAYGSNLDVERMRRRCPSSRLIEVGQLQGYRLEFTGYSKCWHAGTADVVPCERGEVWGLLYELSASDLKRLDGYEGPRYTKLQTTVVGRKRSFPMVWVYWVPEKGAFNLKPA